jgi:hypothetical protein
LYEKRAVEMLFEMLHPAEGRTQEVRMYPGRWFKYTDKHSIHYCQPDLIVEFPAEGRATVFEIKAFHTENAWWQLNHLYKPVLEKYWPDYQIQLIELVKSFDPAAPWPEKNPDLRFGGVELKKALRASEPVSDKTLVIQWKPMRKNREEREEWLRHL